MLPKGGMRLFSVLIVSALFVWIPHAASGQVLSVSCTPTTGPVTAGVTYSATCTASGGIAPYSWSISSGTLPTGLNLTPSSDTTSSAIAGTPTTSGSYNYTVQVTDSTPVIPMTATQDYSGTVAPNITSISPTGEIAGQPGFTLTVNGAGFGSDSVVNFNTTALTTTVVSSSQVTASVPMSLTALAGTDSITLTSGGATSNAASFTVSPIITSLSPNGATAGGPAFTLTVNGMGFSAGATVKFSSSSLSATVFSSTQLTAAVPASLISGAGTFPVSIISSGVASSSVNFTVKPAPAISSISPTNTPAGSAAFTLTVNGSNFGRSSVVNFNGTTLTTTVVSVSQLTASVPPNLIATTGTFPVTVTSGGVTSNSVSFTIPGPAITSVSPDGVTAGGAAFLLTVSGSSFVNGSVVKFNGTPLSTTFLSTGELTATVPASLITTAGSTQITVTSGAVTSNSVSFAIVPAPAISSISPTSATAGGPGFQLTINGSGFSAGAVVDWNSTALSTTLNSATQLAATVSPSLIAAAGTSSITVKSGGATSNVLSFAVVAGPVISSLTPNAITAGSGAGLSSPANCPSNVAAVGILIVNGSGFAQGAVAKWNGQPIPSTLVNSSQVSACVPSSVVQGYGTAQVTIGSGSATSNALPISLESPAITLTGLQSTSQPTQQVQVGIQLASATPAALTGTLQLSFSTTAAGLPAGYMDPALQFASGGTTLNFTIPAGSTSVSPLSGGTIQQGTVEGTVTVTLTSLNSGGTNLLPSSPVTSNLIIPALPPVITAGSAQITNFTSTGFDVVVTGYSTTRDMTSASFSFNAASGTSFTGATTFSVPVSSVFATWFSSQAGQANGSMFLMTVPFTISGNADVLQSVTVTLENSAGISASASASR